MMNGHIDLESRVLYDELFLIEVHSLLFLGHQDARSKINSDSEEDDITGFITESIEFRTDELPFLGRYKVREQKPVHHSERSGKRRQKIDLIFESSDANLKKEFCCEAKRLKTSVCTISDYVGDEGMQCFLRCEYAQNDSISAMIGYIQNSTITHWCSELNRSFEPENDLNIQDELQERKILDELPNEWFSSHARTKDNKKYPDIGIYHIFLECHTLE